MRAIDCVSVECLETVKRYAGIYEVGNAIVVVCPTDEDIVAMIMRMEPSFDDIVGSVEFLEFRTFDDLARFCEGLKRGVIDRSLAMIVQSVDYWCLGSRCLRYDDRNRDNRERDAVMGMAKCLERVKALGRLDRLGHIVMYLSSILD